MLGTEECELNSPITPLNFDFGRKKRPKPARSDSPDILKRITSPDLVQRVRSREKHGRSVEDLGSPDYSDYAPVSTDRWIITDNSQGKEIHANIIIFRQKYFSS